jgi:sensor histidine kinase YesM
MFEYIYQGYQYMGHLAIITLLQYTLSKFFTPKQFVNKFINYGIPNVLFCIIYYFPQYALGNSTIPYYYYFASTMIVSFTWALIFLTGKAIQKLPYLVYFYAVYKCFKFILGALYMQQYIMTPTIYKILDFGTFFIILTGMYALTRIFLRFPLKFQFQLTFTQTILLIFCPVSFFLLLQMADPSVHVPYMVFLSVAAIVLLINLPILFYLYSIIGEQYESRYLLTKALTETSAQLTRYRYTILNEEQANKERHELKNKYFYIQTLLHEKKYDQLDNFLSDHIGGLTEGTGGIHTKNLLIDHILNTKISAARKSKIKTYTEILVPEELNINEEYFCTILLNLLDNAIEASTNESDPDIQIFMNIQNQYLVCCVKNKVASNILEKNPELQTTKSDKKTHGLGLKIIKSTVKKTNGIFDISIESNYFVATVMIPLIQ